MVGNIEILMANKIAKKSWINDPRYAWFKDGYGYASSQTRAIPCLAKVSPEELYFAVWAIIRGGRLYSENTKAMLEDLGLNPKEKT